MNRSWNKFFHSVGKLLLRNMIRWKWRLGLVAFLVAGSITISVLYGSMMHQASELSLNQVKPLHLPFDVMVILDEGQVPRTSFDFVLGTYRYEETSGVLRGRTVSVPITVQHFENALAVEIQSPMGIIEVWGIESSKGIFRSDIWNTEGSWPKDHKDIWFPIAYREKYDLNLGDSISVSYQDRYGVRTRETLFICGFGSSGSDLERPQVTLQTAQRMSGHKTPNRQFLNSLTFDKLTDWNLFFLRMEQAYPGSTIIFEQLPQVQWQDLMGAIQSPGKWVLLLVFMFLAVAVLTISLMTFLERKQELAILKTLGMSNEQLSVTLFFELLLFGILGYALGVVLVIVISQVVWNQTLDQGSIFFLLFTQHGALTFVFFCFAVLYPLLLAKIASVNQLLYARDIPLWVARYDRVPSPPTDWLQEMNNEHVLMLKLTVVDGKLLSALLKNVGEPLKKGEVVAFMYSLAGFYYQEWFSPCDGTIVSFQETNGKLIIEPDSPDEPIPSYSSIIQGQKKQF